jgi:hypothetical protein
MATMRPLWPAQRRVLPALLTCALLSNWAASAVRADEPPLAALVPDDVGLYLEADRLPERLQAWEAQGLLARFDAFAPLGRWRREVFEKLGAGVDQAARELNLTPAELRDRLAGRRTALAVWPPDAPGGTDRPVLALMQQADVPQAVDFVDRLVAAHQRSGRQIDAHDAAHAGVDYRVCVVDRDGGPRTLCAAALGSLAVLASDESLIQRVVDLHTQSGAGSLAESAEHRAAVASAPSAAVLWVFLNPRAFDAEVISSRQGVTADAGPTAAQQAEIDFWRALRHAQVALEPGPDVRLELRVAWDASRFSSTQRAAVDRLAGSADYAARVPRGALAYWCGTPDVGPSLDALLHGEAAPTEATGDAGGAAWQLLRQSLGRVGPRAGLALLEAADRPADENPLYWLGAAELASPGSDAPSAAGDLRTRLATVAALAVQWHNRRHPDAPATVRQAGHGDTAVVALEGLPNLPRGLFLAPTVDQSWLLASDRPEAVADASASTPTDRLAADPRYAELFDSRWAGAGHVLYLDCAALRRTATAHESALVAALAKARGVEPEQARDNLQRLIDLLRVADRLLCTAQVDESGLVVGARLAVD